LQHCGCAGHPYRSGRLSYGAHEKGCQWAALTGNKPVTRHVEGHNALQHESACTVLPVAGMTGLLLARPAHLCRLLSATRLTAFVVWGFCGSLAAHMGMPLKRFDPCRPMFACCWPWLLLQGRTTHVHTCYLQAALQQWTAPAVHMCACVDCCACIESVGLQAFTSGSRMAGWHTWHTRACQQLFLDKLQPYSKLVLWHVLACLLAQRQAVLC
jgi:hypothetical protein